MTCLYRIVCSCSVLRHAVLSRSRRRGWSCASRPRTKLTYSVGDANTCHQSHINPVDATPPFLHQRRRPFYLFLLLQLYVFHFHHPSSPRPSTVFCVLTCIVGRPASFLVDRYTDVFRAKSTATPHFPAGSGQGRLLPCPAG